MKNIWNRSRTLPANQTLIYQSLCTLVIAATALILCGSARAQQTNTGSAVSEVAHGKYLVESVAMCVQCHTPRNADGTLDRSRLLQGAPVIWQPADHDSNWPLNAPRIGGTLPAGDADMIKLLTTGIWTNGKPLRLPMMPFRMNESDAKAVIAYLKSVTPER
jgi:mono/diheme cytochrome c family protein